ncbi:hydantoinase/oxoprolinase family protein, partial [Myxococcota bacterium]|nr:hydantoinase/oxoprolinase family protein [Myxococcota bacterium]
MPWEFWIDRGGTFTDCIGVSPEGTLYTSKVLSDESAPLLAIHSVLRRAGGLDVGSVLPESRVALGTTVATNALLERRGIPTVLLANRGLGDVLAIGTQERSDLFKLEISKPPPLYEEVVEVEGRVSATGECIDALDLDGARASLERARRRGARSVGIVMLHAYADPEMEARLRDLALDVGFEFAVASHDVAMEIGLLARGETTCCDAYLTPLLRHHLSEFADHLAGARLHCMQSSGGLTDLSRFRGPNALLSGPAGGVVGAERVAESAGFEHAIGFDMGGTSTDVSLIRVGDLERSFETSVGGLRVRAPMLRLHTVAAGGGSICRFDGI